MKIWNLLQKIWNVAPIAKVTHKSPSGCEGHEGELVLHEVLCRDEEELAYYEKWNDSNTKTQMLSWLEEQFQKYNRQCCCDCKINFLMIPSINGFVIQFDEKKWREADFVCLFDYLKFRLKDVGYLSQVSDIKAIRKGSCIETTQRHYLKPPREFGLEYGDKMDQKFGNVMVTLNFVNERMTNLKFSATHYNDHLYKPADSFENLMRCVCA